MKSIFTELKKYGRNYVLNCYEKNEIVAPIYAKIMLNRQCNLRCIKCNQWKRLPRIGLKSEVIKKIINFLAKAGTRILRFIGGEPTLRPDLTYLINYANQYSIDVALTTNGTLINYDLAFKLVIAGLRSISISIDSHDPNIHDRIVGVKGSWEKSVSAIKFLKKVRDEIGSDMKIAINYVITRENYNYFDKYVKFFYKLGVDMINIIPLASYHLDDKSIQFTLEELEYVRRYICKVIEEYQNNIGFSKKFPLGQDNNEVFIKDNVLYTNVYKKIPCYHPWFEVYIKWDGSVTTCCNAKHIPISHIGELLSKEPVNFFNDQNFRLFRENCKPEIKHSMCYRCLHRIERNKKIHQWLMDESNDVI